LEGECKDQDTEEEFVVEELLENIEISFSNFSTVDVVEDLEEHEGVKDPGKMLELLLAILISFYIRFPCNILGLIIAIIGIVRRFKWAWRNTTCWCIELVVKITHGLSAKHKNNHDNCVPGRNTDNLSPDSFTQQRIIGIHGFALDHVLKWGLSRQCKSGEYIHDQVDPQELD